MLIDHTAKTAKETKKKPNKAQKVTKDKEIAKGSKHAPKTIKSIAIFVCNNNFLRIYCK